MEEGRNVKDLIFIYQNNQQYGPYTADEIEKRLKKGMVSPISLAWKKGMPSWEPLCTLLPKSKDVLACNTRLGSPTQMRSREIGKGTKEASFQRSNNEYNPNSTSNENLDQTDSFQAVPKTVKNEKTRSTSEAKSRVKQSSRKSLVCAIAITAFILLFLVSGLLYVEYSLLFSKKLWSDLAPIEPWPDNYSLHDYPDFEPNADVLWSEEEGEALLKLPDGVAMEFVKIPPGSFLMGSNPDEKGRKNDESPRHKVTIDYSFWMAKYEVTQEQWQSVMGRVPGATAEMALPVACVSWFECQEFLKRANSHLDTKELRLPSEAEWEYACRAGSRTTYCFGNDARKLISYAWHKDISEQRIHKVGQKRPNAWGLHDMHGNVSEWCQDYYHDSYEGAPNDGKDLSTPKSRFRVFRGGAWTDDKYHCRCAARFRHRPSSLSCGRGFRVVAVP